MKKLTPVQLKVSEFKTATGEGGVVYTINNLETQEQKQVFLTRLTIKERQDLALDNNLDSQVEMLLNFLNKKKRVLHGQTVTLEDLRNGLSLSDYQTVWAWLRDGLPNAQASSQKEGDGVVISCVERDLESGARGQEFGVVDSETEQTTTFNLAPMTLNELAELNKNPLLDEGSQLAFIANLLSKPWRAAAPVDPDWLAENVTDKELVTIFNWMYAERAEVELDPKVVARVTAMLQAQGQSLGAN